MTELRKYREGLGLSRAEMSEALGVNLATYYKTESGERRPTLAFLKKFKAVCGSRDLLAVFFEN